MGLGCVDKVLPDSSTEERMQTQIDRDERLSGEPQSWWARWKRSEHASGVLLIGLFKLSKALLSIALGVGAFNLAHHDIGNVILRVTDALKIDPESHVVWLLVNKAELISIPDLRRFGELTFLYAALCLVEGTGLMLEKRWAEYFTLILTAAALPWEFYELTKHFTTLRVGLLIINLLVLAYLIWLLLRLRRREAAASS
jgi:uncharacterized membrane protein (DUF2068 family)